MKKIIYSLLMMVVLLPSCLKDDKDIFDKSSADRMTEAMKEYQQALESSPNGWLMSYYPGRDAENEVKAGYNYLVKFKNGEVTAAADFSIANYSSGTEISSLYRIIADEGPVLTFDSYNNLLHNFCTPSSSTPYGSRADYEFTILSASSDSIVLRGKLYRNKIYMTPISKDETWQKCLENISIMRSKFSLLYSCTLTIDGKTVPVNNGTARLLVFSVDGEGGSTDEINAAYRATEDGIQLYKPINIYGKYIQNFKYSNNKFTCTDGVNAELTLTEVPINSTFAQTNAQWFIDIASSSAKVQTAYNTANAAVIAGEGEPIVGIYMGKDHLNSYNGTSMVFGSDAGSRYWWAVYAINFAPVASTNDEMTFTYIPGNLNNEAWYKAYYVPFINVICNASPYKIIYGEGVNGDLLTFESKTDPTISFKVEQ